MTEKTYNRQVALIQAHLSEAARLMDDCLVTYGRVPAHIKTGYGCPTGVGERMTYVFEVSLRIREMDIDSDISIGDNLREFAESVAVQMARASADAKIALAPRGKKEEANG